MRTKAKSQARSVKPGSANQPNPIDQHVGVRLRNRRKQLELSQGQLGSQLGLTFQQVQKYENGRNRLGASRLFEIARILHVSIQYFYDDMPAEIVNRSSSVSGGNEGKQMEKPAIDNASREDQPLYSDVLALVQAYYGITVPGKRKQLLGLLNALTKPEG